MVMTSQKTEEEKEEQKRKKKKKMKRKASVAFVSSVVSLRTRRVFLHCGNTLTCCWRRVPVQDARHWGPVMGDAAEGFCKGRGYLANSHSSLQSHLLRLNAL
jgi:hypothetical protein